MKSFQCKNGASCARFSVNNPNQSFPQHGVEKGRSGCAELPQPPTDTLIPLDGENCIACKDKKELIIRRDENKYLLALTYKQLCGKYIGGSLEEYQGLVNPDALYYTLNPPLIFPPEQRAFNMVPPYPPTPVIDLTGKNILVVGASKNIGLATARTLVGKGARVVGTSRHPECYDHDYPFPLLKLDVRLSESVKEFFKLLAKKYFTNGKIDILINTAAIHWLGMLADANGDDLADSLSLNVAGYQRVVYHALPMMKHPRTRIISLGSIAGEVTTILGGYGISKRALQSWNDQHQIEARLRLALGISDYEPDFSLVEPYFIESTIGLYENHVSADTDVFDLITRATNLTVAALQSATTIMHPILAGQPPCPAVPPLCANTPQLVADAIYQIILAPQPSVRYLVDALPEPVNSLGFVIGGNTLPVDSFINDAYNPFVEQLADPSLVNLSQQVLEDAYCNPEESCSRSSH